MVKQPVQLPLFQEETVSVQWAAEHLRVSAMTVLRYREEGLIRGYQMKARGWWRLIKSSVIEYEQKLRASMEATR
jgi:predicted site-specific integrase-resolvase